MTDFDRRFLSPELVRRSKAETPAQVTMAAVRAQIEAKPFDFEEEYEALITALLELDPPTDAYDFESATDVEEQLRELANNQLMPEAILQWQTEKFVEFFDYVTARKAVFPKTS